MAAEGRWKMGSWGPLPWDDDAAWSFAEPALRDAIARIARVLGAPLRPDATSAEVAVAVAAIDLFVRVAPYWDTDRFESDLRNAGVRLREAMETQGNQCGDQSYDARLLLALEEYSRRDPLTIDGIPRSLAEPRS